MESEAEFCKRDYGAGDRDRTGDIQLGNVVIN